MPIPWRSNLTERSRRRAQLMAQAQTGQAEAFRLLVMDIASAVLAFLRRRVTESDELEDILQETLIAVYESRHTYDPKRLFEPWLFAITRNIVADHQRCHSKRARWQELVDEAPDCGSESGEHAKMAFRHALGQLSDGQREAFMMLKIEGLTLGEASVRAGVSVGAIKVRAHRAYESLKKSLLR